MAHKYALTRHVSMRIQFILKERTEPFAGELHQNGKILSSGLYNSSLFMKQMLDTDGHITEVIHAEDNNKIDALCHKFKPDICIIEAYWVVPEKFEILHKLHPNVKWIIRNHSATPFFANEGVVMDWSLRYMNYKNVFLCSNDIRAHDDIQSVASSLNLPNKFYYLPNFYPYTITPRNSPIINNEINISCFGAMRPLKNHLIQAIAAIKYADANNLKLKFHVNGTRIEMKGEPIIHNLQKIFSKFTNKHELVEHEWLPHEKFIHLMRAMDVSLQVSYTETFNIVSADAVVNDVPIVVSSDIKWAHNMAHADPNDSNTIVNAIKYVLDNHRVIRNLNIDGLKTYSENSRNIWKKNLLSIFNSSI